MMQQREVQVTESGLVPPAEDTPKGGLWISNIDNFMASRHHTPLIYVYRRPSGEAADHFFDAGRLRAALGKALVPFYPVAGRLEKGAEGRLEINCTGEGVRFVVARCEAGVDEFGEFVPSPELRRLFVPSVPVGLPAILFAAQVTFLKDGAVVLGTSMHHGLSDGFSSNHFVKTWANMARGVSELDLPPFLDRTLLRARSPSTSTTLERHPAYKPPTMSSHPASPSAPATAIIDLTKAQLDLLKGDHVVDGPATGSKFSAFQLVSAHLWRAACIARGLGPGQETRIWFPVSVRHKLQLPARFYGNAIYRVVAAADAGEVISKPGSFGAERIQQEIAAVSDEHVRSLIDALEGVRMSDRVQPLPATDFATVSWIRMPVHELDFGWGKPEIVTRATLGISGFGYIMDDPRRSGDIRVLVGMEEENMEKFKKAFYETLN